MSRHTVRPQALLHRRRWLLLTVFLLLLAVVAVPQQASGQPTTGADLECPDAATLHFEPGLTSTPQRQTISGILQVGTALSPSTPCTSATGIPYQGATGKIEGTGVLGCTAAPGVMEAHGTVDVVWDNGDKSVVSWETVTYGAVPTVRAKFVEGPLKGSEVIQEAVPTGVTGNCGATRPLTDGGFTGTVQVIPL